ncbi:MAG: cadmium-translocating P-type ATPase, partial [Oscillospiraceae bacterium]|nr:cadmium-translocating P-type ATPase [Oscillospiraceae bacterium]
MDNEYRRQEPAGAVCACEAHGHSHDGGEGKRAVLRLAAGALLLAAGLAARLWPAGGAYASAALFLAGYAVLGWDVVWRAVRNIAKGKIFDEHFLMSAATMGAFALGEFPEAASVMLFYQIGEYFQGLAVRRSRKSIAGLMDLRPDSADVKRDGGLHSVPPDTVRVGEQIVVKPGGKVPLDGIVIEGAGFLDTGPLTGEPLPRAVGPGDSVFSGCINQNGLLTVEVTKAYGESTVAKILDLVEHASAKKAPAEHFITAFARYYTPAVVGLALLLAVLPPLLAGGQWDIWVRRALVFLVISCPCALVVSIPLSFFGGIGGASRRGILVKGGNYLDALNRLDIVVFDKTGTLTAGVFEVTEVRAAAGYTEERVLEMAARAESGSHHPIALSVRRAHGKAMKEEIPEDYEEIAGQGVRVTLDGERVLAGNQKLMEGAGISIPGAGETGTAVYVAAGGRYAGCILISDEVKPDSRAAILGLKAAGVRQTVMLTGDAPAAAERVARELGLDEVHARLLPHEKVEQLERLYASRRPGGKLAFMGDGVNYAPVLARADIGIS